MAMASGDAPRFDAAPPATQTEGREAPFVRRERRLPIALTLLAIIALALLLHDRLSVGPKWIAAALAGVLLVALVVADPSHITPRARMLRLVAITLVVLLVGKAFASTVRLVADLLAGGPETANPTLLLTTGALVWIGNNVIFALLFWELDSGGPAARARGESRYPDLAFPGHLNPELVPPGWRPVFVDYLYLSLNNALAFSPTDTIPLATWAKLTMAMQSLISVAIVALVIARAVNIFK